MNVTRNFAPSPPSPRSRPCSLEEQYFKCGIFWDYDAPQRRVSNSEAPVLAGGIPVFLRGSQFSGASELKEGPVSKYKFINTTRLQLSYFCNCTIDLTKKWLYLHIWRLRVRVLGGIGFHHTFHQLVASIEREMTTHLCTECGKSFTEEVLLLIHQTRIHDKTSYSCDECGADVIGKVSLSNHKRRHKIPAVKNLRKHKCEKCPYESEVKSNVNRHKKQVHEQKPDKVKKSWNCDKCETKHTSKYGYDRHVKTHEKRSS